MVMLCGNARQGTVDPHLSVLLMSGYSDYADWILTVQLDCFVLSVHFIRIFEWSSV